MKEYITQKNFNRYTKENVENKKQRINNIVKFHISPFKINMIDIYTI